MENATRIVKQRNIFLVYLFSFITLGVYGWYWTVSTKNDINSKGEYHIPTAWIWLIPFVGGIIWMYKYCQGLSKNVRHDDHAILWFILWILPTSIIMPGIVQSSLNKVATGTIAQSTAPLETGLTAQPIQSETPQQ